MYSLAPSVYAADYMKLKQQLQTMEEGGVTCLHLDVMDGNFVPNLSFGADFVGTLRAHTRMKLDVHFMVREPIRFVKEFVNAGGDVITVHLEACQDLEGTLDAIHGLGKEAGIALKPGTGLQEIPGSLWNKLDVLQIMTVAPGLKGQHFMPDMLDKIALARTYVQNYGRKIEIEVDGDIVPDNLNKVMEAGASIIVAGKGLFLGSLKDNLKQYLTIINRKEEEGHGLSDRN